MPQVEDLPLYVSRPKRDRAEITIPAMPNYDISEPETLTLTLPAEATRSRGAIVAWPALIIRASPRAPAIGVSLHSAYETYYAMSHPKVVVRESSMRAPPPDAATPFGRLLLKLTDDIWVDEIDGEGAASTALLRALRSTSEGERDGWNARVQSRLSWHNLSRYSHDELEVPSPPPLSHSHTVRPPPPVYARHPHTPGPPA